MVFLDITCPRCGNTRGNGGIGDDAFCPLCGYAGVIRLSEEDVKFLNKAYQRHLERNREEEPHAD